MSRHTAHLPHLFFCVQVVKAANEANAKLKDRANERSCYIRKTRRRFRWRRSENAGTWQLRARLPDHPFAEARVLLATSLHAGNRV